MKEGILKRAKGGEWLHPICGFGLVALTKENYIYCTQDVTFTVKNKNFIPRVKKKKKKRISIFELVFFFFFY
jgi:hypothetical protein